MFLIKPSISFIIITRNRKKYKELDTNNELSNAKMPICITNCRYISLYVPNILSYEQTTS